MRLRNLRFIPIFLFALLAVFIGGLLILLGTEPGTRWVVMQTALHTPGTLRIGRIEGTLLGRLSLHQIEYRKDQTTLTLDRIILEWRPIGLLAGDLRITNLAIERLRVAVPPQTETGTTTPTSLPVIRIPISVTVEKAVVDGLAIVSGKQETALDQVSFSGRASESGIRIDNFKVAAPAYTVILKGHVIPEGAYPFDATLTWSARLQDAQGLNLKGEAEIKGDLNQIRIVHHLTEPMSVEAEGIVELKKAQLTSQNTDRGATSTGNPTGFSIRSFRFLTLGGEITLAGEASWSPNPAWELTLTGSSLNPGIQWPGWDGAISFAMSTKGRFADGILASFQIERLTGTSHGQAVTAMGGLDLEGETVRINRLSLHSGTARLSATGILSPRWDLVWSLNTPDLSHLLPGASGRFVGNGKLEGEPSRPTVTANAEGSRLTWNDAQIDKVKLRLLIDLQDRVESYVSLSAEGLRGIGPAIDRVELTGKGKRAGHRFQTDLKAGEHRLILQMQGRIEDTGWDGKLLRTTMSEEEFGQWVLEKPVSISIKTDSAEVAEGCWKHAEATVCVNGRWLKGQGWETSGRAMRIPLSLIKPWIPANLSLSGTVNGSWEASSGKGTVVMKTRWTPSQGQIEYQTADGNHLTIGYREGYFQTTIENKSLRAETELTLIGQGRLRADLTLSPFDLGEDWKQSGLQGSVRAEFSQLGLIAAFTPVAEKTEGKIKLDLTIGGTPEKPRVNGTAVLDQGFARIPALGIEIKQLRLTVTSRNEETIAIEGMARSGPGSVTIKGTVGLNAAQGWPIKLVIKGDRFQLADLPAVRLFASPDLVLVIQHRRIDLTGKVLIPEADIKIRDLPKETATVSDDVVIVRSPGINGGPAKTPWEIHTRVTIQLGEKVKFSGFGLSGDILGQVVVSEGPNRTTTGEGGLRIVNGKYEAYGQKLEIENGRLLFTGPLDDPGIDVRATRKIDQIVVGIRVAGTIKHPEITLFSEPPMDQANALAYLLLGQPLGKASQSEGAFLMNAISALGLEGGYLMAQKIGKTLGLDVKVESGGGTEGSSVVIGRYLSPKFYVSYGIGLFDSASTIRLRYEISKALALRAVSGEQTGIDLLFIKEFK